MKRALTVILAMGVAGWAAVPAGRAADDASGLKDQKEKLSYGIGMSIGGNLKRAGFDVDVDILAGAIKDVLGGKETKLTDQQSREVIQTYQKEMSMKREEERKKVAEKNRAEGEAFLAQNKKKDGIKTQTVTLPDGKTTAEFQYKVITPGSGTPPKTTDTVNVNYRGTLINGKEFDSSAKLGKPYKTPVTGVIKGWIEALQMMPPGAKWELYLPSTLAYGDFGSPPMIEPGSALVFEMELVNVETPQPLTSDIIKVPSAEELKKGAKIEVLKPEDVERLTREAAATNKPAEKQ
jgi:FKBP-type peptidyl-prolyl cis-trans isomerase FklB